jgi:hypothetical protein
MSARKQCEHTVSMPYFSTSIVCLSSAHTHPSLTDQRAARVRRRADGGARA